jgi:hypothetical protein
VHQEISGSKDNEFTKQFQESQHQSKDNEFNSKKSMDPALHSNGSSEKSMHKFERSREVSNQCSEHPAWSTKQHSSKESINIFNPQQPVQWASSMSPPSNIPVKKASIVQSTATHNKLMIPTWRNMHNALKRSRGVSIHVQWASSMSLSPPSNIPAKEDQYVQSTAK